ncbi:MAG: beta-N-acetylglucosaminidase domain-containing protein [bacterium]|nr:beta-N-acetylglucosaminidase domain-containing protein [bacterium]
MAMQNSFGSGLSAFQIPYYTGTILPTPQKVTYYDEYIPLTHTGIYLGKGITKEDPRIEMLIKRIIENGGQVEFISQGKKQNKYSCILILEKNKSKKHFLNKEGYCIYPTKKENTDIVAIQSNNGIGLLWAIISFNQLVTNQAGTPVVRKAEIYDYPDVEKRGFLATPWSSPCHDWAWFAIQFKFNTLVFTIPEDRNTDWKNWRHEPSAEWKGELKKIGDILNPIDISWYISICPIRGNPEDKIRSNDTADFAAIYRRAELIAQSGGNVMLLYDDTRFPINPVDEKTFGSAREADIYVLNKLHQALRKKYPQVKLLFCPPFYWGPLYPPKYPESREDYLTALGTRVPKDIDIFWTGPAVCSAEINKHDVIWITNLIRRKPWLWQNGTGSPHAFMYHYVTDPLTSWKKWYYPEFFKDIAVYTLNTNVPHESTALVTLVDYLWNHQAYQSDKSVAEAAKKLTGVETFSYLQELNKLLSYFDRYGLRVDLVSIRNIAEIKEKVAELETAWKNCLSFYPEAVKKWTSLERHVNQQKAFLAKLEKHHDLSQLVKQIEGLKEIAKRETALDETYDIFLSPYDFSGGYSIKVYELGGDPRLATWIYGAKTNFHKLEARFRLGTPPITSYTLLVSAQPDEGPKPCRIRITINNNKVYEGDSPFNQLPWSIHRFPVPEYFLKEGDNSLTIENLEDSDRIGGYPFFMFNYAVIKQEGDAKN